MSFREYLQHRRITDTPAGDFVADARRDRMPDIETWDQLETYLLMRSACREAITAARQVWRQYRRRAGAR